MSCMAATTVRQIHFWLQGNGAVRRRERSISMRFRSLHRVAGRCIFGVCAFRTVKRKTIVGQAALPVRATPGQARLPVLRKETLMRTTIAGVLLLVLLGLAA